MKKMKAVLAVLLVLCMITGCSSITPTLEKASSTPEPKTIVSGDYQYLVMGDGTACITKYSGRDTELSIPKVIDEYKVTSIGD